jgi:hypothetical protein
MELHGMDPYCQAQIYKLASSGLCSGVAGQIMTSLMVKPPQEGDESYAQHTAEEAAIFDSLYGAWGVWQDFAAPRPPPLVVLGFTTSHTTITISKSWIHNIAGVDAWQCL